MVRRNDLHWVTSDINDADIVTGAVSNKTKIGSGIKNDIYGIARDFQLMGCHLFHGLIEQVYSDRIHPPNRGHRCRYECENLQSNGLQSSQCRHW